MRVKRRVDRDRSNTVSPNTSTSPATVNAPAETAGPTPGSSSEANGCNSEDEYESRPTPENQMTEEELNEVPRTDPNRS